MVLSWTYFLILQTVILAIFYLKRNYKDDYIFSKLFPTKLHFVGINACVFISCYFYNTERQLFCRPVPWAAAVIILFCVSFLILPFINKYSRFLNIIYAVCGLGFFISIYILLFARGEYLIFVTLNLPFILILNFILRFIRNKYHTNVFDALNFYPSIILAPYLLLYQLWILVKSSRTRVQQWLFIATPILSLIVCLLLTYQINNLIHKIEDPKSELKEIVSNPINRYLTELILGAHWKYHTELCLYDGWRPPFHDPILVIANKILFPFERFISLDKSMYLYIIIYPDNATVFDCKCALNERLFDL
jgi:hypothetical protein